MFSNIKILYLFFLLMLMPFSGVSQYAKLEGRIIGSDGNLLPFANIVLDNTPFASVADESGRYEIAGIPFGHYEIIVSCIGYKGTSKEIDLNVTEIKKLNFTLISSDNSLKEIVVSGTLKETSVSLSPIKVDILSRALFTKNPVPSIFESLSMVNGVQPQLNCNICNTGDIHINGMEGPYTMVTLDGMPIVSGLSTVYGLSGIPNSIINRVEVVKGPASTLYGSEAVAGLINIITKDPDTLLLYGFDLFATSQNEWNCDVYSNIKFARASSVFGVNYFNFKNRLDINSDNFTDIALQERISVFNKWNFNRKENYKSSLAFRYVYEDRFGGEMQWKKEFRGTDSVYGESIFTSRYELIGNYQLPVKKGKLFFQYSLNKHIQNSAYGNVIFNASQDILFGQFLWDKKINSRNDAVIGIPVRFTFFDDNTIITAYADSQKVVNMPQKVLLPGFFIQDEIALKDGFTTLLGIRYDYNSMHGNILSPRVAIKYSFSTVSTLRFSMGNGYRVVNLFTEDHAALTGARKVEIISNLEPERSYNANLNYHYILSFRKGFVNMDASIFYTYFTNKIIADYNTDANKILYDNLNGHAISRGANMNIDVSMVFGLKALLGLTWMNVFSIENGKNGTQEKTDQLFAPDLSGTFSISYPIPVINISVDYTGRITGPMYLPVVPNDYRPIKSPCFSIQNIQFTKKVKKIEFYAGIKNLLNFIPQDPILRPFDPFDKRVNENNPYGYTFDPTYMYAPIQGIRCFAGIRMKFNK